MTGFVNLFHTGDGLHPSRIYHKDREKALEEAEDKWEVYSSTLTENGAIDFGPEIHERYMERHGQRENERIERAVVQKP